MFGFERSSDLNAFGKMFVFGGVRVRVRLLRAGMFEFVFVFCLFVCALFVFVILFGFLFGVRVRGYIYISTHQYTSVYIRAYQHF